MLRLRFRRRDEERRIFTFPEQSPLFILCAEETECGTGSAKI
jgi:hypothetical protein